MLRSAGSSKFWFDVRPLNCKETLGNISHLSEPIINLIRRALKGETFVNPEDGFHCTRSLPHGHVAAVLATLQKLKLDSLLARTRIRDRDLIVALIVARVIDAQSKLATARALSSETALSTLSETLGLGTVDENEIYEAMDRLLGPRQVAVENALARRYLRENTLVLYVVTSVYLEGRRCQLAQRGCSRDGKRGKLQIVIGLLCSPEGCPMAVEVFEGSTGDPGTVASQVEKIRSRFGLRRVVLVGDRGMLTAARIREDLQGVEGLHWITAMRAPTIRSLVKEGTVQRSLFDQRDLAEVTSDLFPGERLIVCYNPLLAHQRRRRRQEKIDAEAQLDGIYIVRTSLDASEIGAAQAVEAYKNLSQVERAFRSLKTAQLALRPVYVYSEAHVRGHVFLCLLAYYLEWHLRRALAPLLFEEEDRSGARALRKSPVEKAQVSDPAKAKAARKRTVDGYPVQSFRTLLADLGTLTLNQVTLPHAPQHPFAMFAKPTPLQAKAFDLLGVDPTRFVASKWPG